jgi:hypothetical protein
MAISMTDLSRDPAFTHFRDADVAEDGNDIHGV